MSAEMRLPGTVAEVEASAKDPKIGAFFDLDGTLIAGYSAQHLATDRMKRRDIGAGELLRTLGVVVGNQEITQSTMAELLGIAASAWSGRAREDLDEMGLRLFEKKIRDQIFPEMVKIVKAHQAQGHTVALTSSATSFQVEPVARYLGIKHVVCNRFADEDGVLTGEVEHPVLWGPGKSDAAQAFASNHGIDLDRSYFYADGDEDTAFMYLVGHPRPTNPGDHLRKVATKRGWPIVNLESRGRGSMLRSVAALGTLLPIATTGIGLGLLAQNKRTATNFVSENWVKAMFAINGVKINVVNEHNAWAARPAVFMFNHRNGFDPFIATKIIGKDFTGVAKGELRKDPIIGTFGRVIDIAFVDRGDTEQSVSSLKAIEEMATKGLSVIIAPEGTRLDTEEVGPFKKGGFRIAMSAGIPIVPIVIRNAEMIGGRNATTMNPGTVDVAVLEPVFTNDWKLADLDENIASVRQMYLDTLANWPGTDGVD